MSEAQHEHDETIARVRGRQHPAIVKAIHTNWALYSIIIALAASYLLTFGLDQSRRSAEHRETLARQAQESADLQCIANWANQFTTRSRILSELSNARSAAEAKVFHDVRLGHFTLIQKDSAAYDEANTAYNNAVKTHPVPDSPKFVCGLNPAGSHYPAPGQATITTTQTLPPRTTTTVKTMPGATVTNGGGQVTQTVPEPGRTVTKVRTRTTTIRPKPTLCIGNRSCVTLPIPIAEG